MHPVLMNTEMTQYVEITYKQDIAIKKSSIMKKIVKQWLIIRIE